VGAHLQLRAANRRQETWRSTFRACRSCTPCQPAHHVNAPPCRLKQREELAAEFAAAGADLSAPIVFSCASGTTACILALALEQVQPGKRFAVYDGSWTEWAQLPDVPKVTGAES
jgi:3-mercaptopyruvate sulfurtransferase SseA